MKEIFVDQTRTSGDLAGVFEFDGETSYFYLYRTGEFQGQKILESIRICAREPDFTEEDVSVRWDAHEEKVGLYIRESLWAVFDTVNHASFGGNYETNGKPILPAQATAGF
jgi:hypothetical protein